MVWLNRFLPTVLGHINHIIHLVNRLFWIRNVLTLLSMNRISMNLLSQIWSIFLGKNYLTSFDSYLYIYGLWGLASSPPLFLFWINICTYSYCQCRLPYTLQSPSVIYYEHFTNLLLQSISFFITNFFIHFPWIGN